MDNSEQITMEQIFRRSAISVTYFFFLIGLTIWLLPSARAMQVETSVGCVEGAEPLALAYGDKTTGCGLETGADEDTFSFVGATGDEININLRSLAGGLDPLISLRDPSGAEVTTGSCSGGSFGLCSFTIAQVLPQSGVYTLVLSEINLDEAGGYSLVVERVFPTLNPVTLTFDVPVSDELTPTVDMDFYEFTGATGDEININLRSLAGGLDPLISLRDPSGAEVTTGSCSGGSFGLCSFTIAQVLPQSGVYTLVLSEINLDEAGGYSLVVERVFPTLNPVTLTFDVPVSDELTPTVDMDFYEFTGATGDEININLRSLAGGLDPLISLRDPSGAEVTTGSCSGGSFGLCSFTIAQVLPQSGVYTLVLSEINLDEAGGYSLVVERVFPTLNPVTLTFDVPVSDELTPTVDMDFYEFTGATGDEININLRSLAGGLDPLISLRDPSGAEVTTGSCSGGSFGLCSFTIAQVLPQSGVYTLVLSEINLDEAGGYSLVVERVFPTLNPVTLTFDVPVSDELTPTVDMDFYEFTGATGDEININLRSLAGGLDPLISLRDPSGAEVTTGSCSGGSFGLCSFTIAQVLPQSGVYTLVLSEINLDEAGGYELTATCYGTCPDPSGTPILTPIGNQTINEGATLTIPISASDSDVGATLTFSLSAPAFVSLTDNGNGTGELIITPTFNDSGDSQVTVTVTDNNGVFDSETFTVTVNDLPPPIAGATPASIDFGDVVVGTTANLSTQLSNTGGSILLVSNISSSGEPFIAYPPTGFELDAGNQRAIDIGFAPVAEGDFSGSITIANNSGTTVDITVSGRGVAAVEPGNIDVPDQVDFGHTAEGSTKQKTLTIDNTGGGPLTVTGALSDNTVFQIATTPGVTFPLTINPGDSRNLSVTFAPPASTDGTDFTANLTINSDDQDEPVSTIALFGTAVGAVEPPRDNPVLDAHVQIGSTNDLITAASCSNVSGIVSMGGDASSADTLVVSLVDQGGTRVNSANTVSIDGAGTVDFSGIDACGLSDGTISLDVLYTIDTDLQPAVPGTPAVKNTSVLAAPVLDALPPFSLAPVIEVCGTSRANTTVRIEGGARVVSTRLDAATSNFCLPVTLRQNTENTLIASAIDDMAPAPKPIASAAPVKIVHVDPSQIVIAEVRSRPLTVEEIDTLVQQGVISLDESENFNVSMFTIVLTIGSFPVTIEQPIVINPGNPGVPAYGRPRTPGGGGWSTSGPTPPPSSPGVCTGICFQSFVIPPPNGGGQVIPGVIIIDGRIKTLKEFFQVTVLLNNASSSFDLSGMNAAIATGDPLTTVGIGLGDDPVDVNPVGTSESIIIGDIAPGATGTAQFIVRGDAIGTHPVSVSFDGEITGGGLPTGIPVSGSASTSVEVLGPPQLGVVVRHPSDPNGPDVALNQIYDLIVEITNQSDRPALYTSLELFVGGDARLVGINGLPIADRSEIKDFGVIEPGATVTAGFRVQSLAEGDIIACQAIAAENIMLTVDAGPVGADCNIVNTFPPKFVPLDPDHEPVVLAINPLHQQTNIPVTSSVVAVFTPQTECLVADTWENVVTAPIDPSDPSRGVQVVSADLVSAGTYYLEELDINGDPVRHIPTDLTVENPPAGGTTIAVLRLGLDAPNPNSQFFLSQDTAYRATIVGGVDGVCSSSSGLTMSDNYSWIFYTGDGAGNNPPVMNDIADQSVDEGATLALDISATDPDSTDTLSFSINGPAFITLVDNGDRTGVLTITPGFDDTGVYPVTVTVTDNAGLSDSTTFSLTVVDTNRAPSIDPIGDLTLNEGVTADISLTSSDPDIGDTLTLSVSGPSFITLTDNGDGTGQLDVAPGFTDAGVYPVVVTVTDQGGLTASASFEVTVVQVNLPPVLANIGDQQVDENGNLTIPLSATDPDAGDVLTFAVSGPAFVSLTDNGDRSGTLSVAPGFNDAGAYSITVTVSDQLGLTDSETFVLTVDDVNRAPVLDLIGDFSVDEGDTLSVTVTASDPDGDALQFSASGLPTGAQLVDNGDGTAQLSWIPDFNQAGSYQLTVTVTDDGTPPASDSELVTIDVGDINRPPVLDPIGNQAVDENAPLSIPLNASDPDGDDLSFSSANLPTGAQLVDNGDGTAQLTWTPDFGQAGNFQVTLIVTDDGQPNLADEEVITITVGDINRPPVLDPIGNRSATEGVELSFVIRATDPDGDNIALSAGDLPDGSQLVDNGDGTATFTWTPGFDQSGNHDVLFIATDDGSPVASDNETITISVGDVNRPPVLADVGSRQVDENTLLTFVINATDPDGDNLAFSTGALPNDATLTDNGDGTATFSWTPDFSQAGNFAIEFIVTDDGTPPAGDRETITVTVGDVNRPPVLDPIGDRGVTEDSLLSFFITASDPDGDTLFYSISGLPSGATFVDNADTTAQFTWQPPIGSTGDYVVTITVTDNGTPILSDSEVFTINVESDTGCNPGSVIGDLDDDCDVDRDDLNIVLAARNSPASGPNDPRDLDGDGVITVLDARILITLCTRNRCATQ